MPSCLLLNVQQKVLVAFCLIKSRCYQQQLGFERKENEWSLFLCLKVEKKQNKKAEPTNKQIKPQATPSSSLRETGTYGSVRLSHMGFYNRLFLASRSPCTLSHSTVTSLADIPQNLLTS